jgi:hypothetical protein
VLEFIAHQPENAGPMGTTGGQIGYDRARHILEKGGDERAAYLSRFQEANPQYTIQSVNVAGAQSALNSQYETQAQQYRNDAGIQVQHQANTQSVQTQAKAAGLDQSIRENPQKGESVRASVQKQFEDTKNKIEEGRQPIINQEQHLQSAERASQEKTLGGTAIKNIVSSGGEGVLSVGKDVLAAVEKHPPHEASPYFAGWSQPERQGEQKQASSMTHPTQGRENSQSATASQGGSPQNPQASQTPQSPQIQYATLSQNHTQNTQEILNQSNGMGVSSHNASVSSVERTEEGRHTQQTKQGVSEVQDQQVSMGNPVQVTGSSQFEMASQGGASQISQSPQTHQVAFSQNYDQNTQEILNQSNDMAVSSHNASASSVERTQQGRQSSQTKQEISENQQQQLSMGNPTQVKESSQFAMASQGMVPQISQNLQSFQTHQANSSPNHDQKMQEVPRQWSGTGDLFHSTSTSSVEGVEQGRHMEQPQSSMNPLAQHAAEIQAGSFQNHAQNTQEISNRGNGIGVSSHKASTPSVERTEQGRQSPQTKQGTSENQQQQPSPKKPVQSAGKSQSSSASQEGVAQTSQTFKEEVNSFFKNANSKIAQSDFAQHEKERPVKSSVIGDPSSERKVKKEKA